MHPLTKEFIAESQEGLERMERCLTELEQRPGDSELLAEIFRTVHTIKGTTGFLGFGRLETLAHAGEELLGAVRKGELAVTSALIGGLLDLLDGLRAILRLIETTESDGKRAGDDDGELIAQLVELRQEGAPGIGADEVAKERRLGRENGSQKPDPSAGPVPAVGRPILPTVRSAAVGTPVAGSALGSPSPASASLQDKTLRIDVEVLNRMVNLVGELVLTRNQILQSGPKAENFPELARRLDSVTAELRESVMQARMQPVGHLFGRYPRMVRDLAKTCGRQVWIEFEGQETGLDKSLLEAIRDPLTHAVRNSVDHGIEPVEERVKAGKPAEGLVRLRAFHLGGSVVIEVSDDGAGISTERVLAKAIERGLATPEQAAGMSEREALRLIFVAGFSTAKEVTNVSGRGVGMDVVLANVERVGGSVEVESRVGVGTTLRLRVPLTLAIVPALVVRSGGQSFALPQSSLVELVYVARRDAQTAVERIGTSEFYRLRERLLPLVWLHRLLMLEEAAEAHGFYIAVVESEGCRYGLAVDDLMAPEEIVVKPLSATLREIGVFSGATVLGSGMLAMILDVAATGARAGVRPVAEVAKVEWGVAQNGARSAPAPIEMESSMVIFEVRSGERMAIPLKFVERIESVPLGEVEFADGRAVLQYRGELLPLEDESEVLRELGARSAAAGETRVPAPGQWLPENQTAKGVAGAASQDGDAATVLICLRPGRGGMKRVGMVVRRVLDVSAGRLLESDGGVGGTLAMVKDRVTTMHRGFAVHSTGGATAILGEVA